MYGKAPLRNTNALENKNKLEKNFSSVFNAYLMCATGF